MVIQIPTRPYLKKFLQHELENESIKIPPPFPQPQLQHPIQLFVITLLNKTHDSAAHRLKKSEKFTDSINIELPYFYARQFGNTIPPYFIDLFNMVAQHHFDAALYQHVHNFIIAAVFIEKTVKDLQEKFNLTPQEVKKYKAKPEIKQALYHFCESIGIEIEYDITYQYLIKKYNRLRSQKLSKPVKKTTGNLQLFFPL